MKHIILGTAGHVDHGKTALIKALTGIDTDRLKEEKERGITIELGFASLHLPNGMTMGIIDVPGHEKFVKHMVSGATGIDLVLMVIAADEGVMPQTREHLQICSLLGIQQGLVALTKIDMVDEDWLELVKDDIHTFLEGSFLDGSPIIPVSAATGAGLPEILEALDKASSEIKEKSDTGLFRLPVDRVFTMKGFGTVVTGTVTSGQINVGDTIQILPGPDTAKIRGIQIHNQPAERAEAGQRTAINLQGTEKSSIERGHVLAGVGTFEPTRRLDVIFDYLPEAAKKIKNRTIVRFHAGTSEIMARLILLDRDELEPGQQAYAQINLESPIVAAAKDRFVVRRYSPVTTIGGGIIIDPLPRKHRRHDDAIMREFSLLQNGPNVGKTAAVIERTGYEGITTANLIVRTGINGHDVKKILESLNGKGQILALEGEESRIISTDIYQTLQKKILDETKQFHDKFPLKEGIPKEELRNVLGDYINPKLFNTAVKDLEKSSRIVTEKEMVRLPAHRVDLSGELDEIRALVADLYISAGLAAPTIKEVQEKFSQRKNQLSKVMTVMIKDGTLVKINEDIYLHKDILSGLRESYKNLLLKDGKATPATFKELTGLSRKFIIPMMEYFDMVKLTIRAGDQRILREK
ncbi:MAG: selenocysteine-specific translation elongation factor [Deltaproteobacteria bacterium]|nr:selenocysteine-specific translation elongation factor [Deltaproteobacteria bacterium]